MKADPREGSQIRAGRAGDDGARARTAKDLVAAADALTQAVADGGEVARLPGC